MDVSQMVAAEPRRSNRTLSTYCQTCGYPRIGLPEGARCPECGDEAVPGIEPVVAGDGAASNRADQAWLAAVAGGLILLVISSFAALQVALVTGLGGLVVAVVNAPGPKLWAASLLHRSIGSPGEWGVYGTVAVLGNVLAVWFVTEPRFVPLAAIGWDSAIRRLARWTCVIGCGGLAGMLWGGYLIDRGWGWDGLDALAIAVGVVELPANALLYWHLSRLARRFIPRDDAPLPRLLAAAAMLLPLVCGAGVVISLVRGSMQDQPVVAWRAIQSAYGALAVSCGIVMTGAVLRLLAHVLSAATDRSVASLAGKLARLRGTLGRLAESVRADPTRWAAAVGLAWWLWNTSPLLQVTAFIGHRQSLGGNLPSFNFIGPKVGAVAIFGADNYRLAQHGSALLATVLAIWLITTLRPPGVRTWAWAVARWTPTLLVGFALALSITIQQADYEIRHSYWAAGLMILVEAPATFVVYRYLAYLADAAASDPRRALSRQLRLVSFAALVVILAPLAFYLMSAPLRRHHDHPLVVIASAGYGMVAVAVGIVAWAVVARLTWTLLTWRRIQPAGVKLLQDDVRSARATAE
jgi:hypothetical protein